MRVVAAEVAVVIVLRSSAWPSEPNTRYRLSRIRRRTKTFHHNQIQIKDLQSGRYNGLLRV
ncbi:uncharacterized protein ANIA_11291 [Aspergillus nidulans FGSC A4]|uniref:Uncharacterized protein n=1 Tax=Emericella nidulans (strain FGSC A4 / ATCC 38163 / CBS 112.46 / NRRL 194 / M139) TaxID=227321 RepID=C8VTV5_EMENI|nr:hypothetical protein [Aspergillus nidulans FGSC A4]CBF88250.1 TPA: hypothetical protein ANIA_11291 [Aspergillus nidulans FGSC A4]